MYLQSIRDEDVGHNKYSLARESRLLYTQDIAGRSRSSRGPSSQPRHNYSLDTSDIEGARPRRHFTPRQRTYQYLSNSDIEGSGVKPMHQLPKRALKDRVRPIPQFCYLPKPPLELKFIRDSIPVDDVEGARHKKFYTRLHNHERTNRIADIPGTSKVEYHQPSGHFDQLNVVDINKYRIFKTSRVADPLTPQYTVPGEVRGTSINIGPVEGSKPRNNHPEVAGRSNGYKLKNDDIDGSKTGTVGPKFLTSKGMSRSPPKLLTRNDDIFGSNAGSLRRGIRTKRHLNPLAPQYQYLGEKQDGDFHQNPTVQRFSEMSDKQKRDLLLKLRTEPNSTFKGMVSASTPFVKPLTLPPMTQSAVFESQSTLPPPLPKLDLPQTQAPAPQTTSPETSGQPLTSQPSREPEPSSQLNVETLQPVSLVPQMSKSPMQAKKKLDGVAGLNPKPSAQPPVVDHAPKAELNYSSGPRPYNPVNYKSAKFERLTTHEQIHKFFG